MRRLLNLRRLPRLLAILLTKRHADVFAPNRDIDRRISEAEWEEVCGRLENCLEDVLGLFEDGELEVQRNG